MFTPEQIADYKRLSEARDKAKQEANAAFAAEMQQLKNEVRILKEYQTKVESNKEAANKAVKNKAEEEKAAAKRQKDAATAASQKVIADLRKEIYKNEDVWFMPDAKPASPGAIIYKTNVLAVDGRYFYKMPVHPINKIIDTCKLCNAPLLFTDNTVANHDPTCGRYNPKLYEAAIDWIRQKGKSIEYKIQTNTTLNLAKAESVIAAKKTFDTLLQEYKNDPTFIAAEAAAEVADKPALMVGQYGSTYAGYRVVTEEDISKPLFAEILQSTHLTRQGLDTFNPFNVTYTLHIEGGKLTARTEGTFRNSYSEITCLSQVTSKPKKPETTLRNVAKYFFYMTNGSENFDNNFKIEKSTVEEKNKSTTPCLFIRSNIDLTKPSAAAAPAAVPLKKGGKQKRNKTHRKYYARRNKKHTRRH